MLLTTSASVLDPYKKSSFRPTISDSVYPVNLVNASEIRTMEKAALVAPHPKTPAAMPAKRASAHTSGDAKATDGAASSSKVSCFIHPRAGAPATHSLAPHLPCT